MRQFLRNTIQKRQQELLDEVYRQSRTSPKESIHRVRLLLHEAKRGWLTKTAFVAFSSAGFVLANDFHPAPIVFVLWWSAVVFFGESILSRLGDLRFLALFLVSGALVYWGPIVLRSVPDTQ